MGRAKSIKKTAAKTPASRWAISEDWLATAIGIAVILLIRLADVSVQWPLFEWFSK